MEDFRQDASFLKNQKKIIVINFRNPIDKSTNAMYNICTYCKGEICPVGKVYPLDMVLAPCDFCGAWAK